MWSLNNKKWKMKYVFIFLLRNFYYTVVLMLALFSFIPIWGVFLILNPFDNVLMSLGLCSVLQLIYLFLIYGSFTAGKTVKNWIIISCSFKWFKKWGDKRKTINIGIRKINIQKAWIVLKKIKGTCLQIILTGIFLAMLSVFCSMFILESVTLGQYEQHTLKAIEDCEIEAMNHLDSYFEESLKGFTAEYGESLAEYVVSGLSGNIINCLNCYATDNILLLAKYYPKYEVMGIEERLTDIIPEAPNLKKKLELINYINTVVYAEYYSAGKEYTEIAEKYCSMIDSLKSEDGNYMISLDELVELRDELATLQNRLAKEEYIPILKEMKNKPFEFTRKYVDTDNHNCLSLLEFKQEYYIYNNKMGLRKWKRVIIYDAEETLIELWSEIGHLKNLITKILLDAYKTDNALSSKQMIELVRYGYLHSTPDNTIDVENLNVMEATFENASYAFISSNDELLIKQYQSLMHCIELYQNKSEYLSVKERIDTSEISVQSATKEIALISKLMSDNGFDDYLQEVAMIQHYALSENHYDKYFLLTYDAFNHMNNKIFCPDYSEIQLVFIVITMFAFLCYSGILILGYPIQKITKPPLTI